MKLSANTTKAELKRRIGGKEEDLGEKWWGSRDWRERRGFRGEGWHFELIG